MGKVITLCGTRAQEGVKRSLDKRSKETGWLAILFIWVIIILAAELIARCFYDKLTPESGRVAVAIMSGELEPGQFGNVRSHPYMLYVNQPGWEGYGMVQFNSMGYRGDEVSLEPEQGVTRILAIGGSTTVGLPYTDRPDQTWPAQLEMVLEEKTGRRIEVINAGLSSATSAELLTHYIFRNRYLKSDIVIIHTGGNDVEALMFEDYNPEYTHYIRGWTANPLAPRWLEKELLSFYIFKVFYAWWLKDTSIQKDIGKKTYFDVQPEEALRNVQVNEPIGFRRNLDLLVRNIKQDGLIPVLFCFNYAPKRVFGNKNVNNYLEPLYDAALIGWNKDIEVMKEIAATYQIPLIEIPQEAIPVEHFYDHCHLNVEGERLKAEYVADYLIPIVESIKKE